MEAFVINLRLKKPSHRVRDVMVWKPNILSRLPERIFGNQLPDFDSVETNLETLNRTSDRRSAARLAEEVIVDDVWVAVLIFEEALGDAGRT